MQVAPQGHLVGRQVEVLLVLDDLPDLAHAERQRVPWQLVLADANETVIACTKTIGSLVKRTNSIGSTWCMHKGHRGWALGGGGAGGGGGGGGALPGLVKG